MVKQGMRFWTALLLPVVTGCGPMPSYFYPVLLPTPAIDVGPAAQGDVRAFRADRTRTIEETPAAGRKELAEETITLEEIPVQQARRVPGQTKLAWKSQVTLRWPGLDSVNLTTTHQASLCLYRPGFECVELVSGEGSATVTWAHAPTLDSQVDALGRLVGRMSRLAPGSASTAHYCALLFASTEYERLAAMAPEGEQRASLAEKARQLRELAAR